MTEAVIKSLHIQELEEMTGINFEIYKPFVYEHREDHGDVEHISLGFKMSLMDKEQLETFRELIKSYKPVEILAGGYDEKSILLGFANRNPGHFCEPDKSFAVYCKYIIRKE